MVKISGNSQFKHALFSISYRRKGQNVDIHWPCLDINLQIIYNWLYWHKPVFIPVYYRCEMDFPIEPEQMEGVGDARSTGTAAKTCPLPEEVHALCLLVQRRSHSLWAPPSRQNCQCWPLLPPIDHRDGEVSQLSRGTTSRFRPCLEYLGFRVLPHSPYSPDLAQSDFHLFRSL